MTWDSLTFERLDVLRLLPQSAGSKISTTSMCVLLTRVHGAMMCCEVLCAVLNVAYVAWRVVGSACKCVLGRWGNNTAVENDSTRGPCPKSGTVRPCVRYVPLYTGSLGGVSPLIVNETSFFNLSPSAVREAAGLWNRQRRLINSVK